MKKLLIYDHRGVLVLAANVFLEGVDFTQEYEEPVPIWIKSIYIVDEELEVLTLAEVAKRKVVLAITSLEESIENESKEADNQGIGDKGIDTAKQHEDAARILEEETRSHLDTRDSKPRDWKATESSLGSRANESSPRSRGEKAFRDKVKE